MEDSNNIRLFDQVIPIKPLTNYELLKYAKLLNFKNFKGVFMRDKLPKKKSKLVESGIVNLASNNSQGTHWVCYYGNNYFDSFGLPPPNEVLTYMQTPPSGRKFASLPPIYYNSNEIQDRESVICGHLCLYVLKHLSDGKSYEEVWKTLV